MLWELLGTVTDLVPDGLIAHKLMKPIANNRIIIQAVHRDRKGVLPPNHARARATQARTGALPVGSADHQNLQGVPAAVPDVRRADAPDCVHHAQRRHPANTRPYRCAV